MLSTRPAGSGATNPLLPSPHDGEAAAALEEVVPDHGGLTATADPVARFVATNGLHPALQNTSGAPLFGGPRNEASGGHPVLETKKGKGTQAVAQTPAPKCTPVAPKSYDLATVTQAEIDELKNAKCGTKDELAKLHRLGFTLENAKAAYADLLAAKPPAKIFVTTSAGNGGQPVMIIAGPKFDPAKPKTVHTHYHGDNATIVDPQGSKAGQNARIRAVITNEDPQTVFVLPEANNTTLSVDSPQNDKSQPGVSWENVSNEIQTTDDALKAAGWTLDAKKDKTVVSMHSGGGMALIHLMWADGKGNNLRADRLELYDCVYHFNSGVKGKTHDAENYIRNWGKTANGQNCERVIFYQGQNNDAAAKTRTIAEGFPPKGGKDRVQLIRMGDEPKIVDAKGKINDAVDPVAKDANGNDVTRDVETRDRKNRVVHVAVPVHNYNIDPHYRTVGEFLGAKPRPQ